jgi:hypothetical protein
MKVTGFVWILVFLAPSIAAAQASTASQNRHKTVILEVAAEDFDIAWRQEYLYLKVLSDGTSECQIVKRKSGDMRFEKADILPVKRSVSQAELEQLKALLAKDDISRLDNTYKQRIAMMLDAGTVWHIRIPRINRTQEIHVVAFAPDAAKVQKRPYPTALLALGCTIEKMRGEAIGGNIDTDDECRKVLPAQ